MLAMAGKLAAVLLALVVTVAPVMTCCCPEAGDELQDQPTTTLASTAMPAGHACCGLSESMTPGSTMPPKPTPKHGDCGCHHTQIIEKSNTALVMTGSILSGQLPPITPLPAYRSVVVDGSVKMSVFSHGNRDDGPYHGHTLRAQACLLTV